MAEQKIEFVSAIAVAYSNTAPSNTEVLWVDLSIAGDSLYDKIKAYKNGSWVLVNRNATEILKDLKTVDGAGSGLDADTLQGLTPDQLIKQSGEVPLLSSGKLLVGQADSIGLAKTISGIATIDTNGVLTLVPGSISHTELTDIGVNTHAQIDSHISDTSNPHSVTATQVGKDTAQWNADRLQGGSLNLGTPGAGQDGYGISWNNGTSSYELVPISANNISNADLTFGDNHYADLGIYSWTLGGTAPIGTEKISLQRNTLVKGSDTSSSTSGFKFVDSTNASLWDFRNNGNIYQGKNSTLFFQGNTLALLSNRNEVKFNTLQSYIDFKDATSTTLNYFNMNANDIQFGVNVDFEVRNLAGTNKPLLVSSSSTNKLQLESIGVTLGNTSSDAILINSGSYGLLRNGSYRMRVNDAESFFGNRTIISATYTESFIGSEEISLQGTVLMTTNVRMAGLPTSSVGLSAGDLWNDAGTLKIV